MEDLKYVQITVVQTLQKFFGSNWTFGDLCTQSKHGTNQVLFDQKSKTHENEEQKKFCSFHVVGRITPHET